MKKWKRVIAVLCALVCVLGMSVSVFAVTYSCVPMPDMKGLLSCIDAEAGVYSVDLSQVLKNTGYVASLNDKWTLLQKDLEDGKDFYTVRYFSFKDHPLGLVICFIPKTANISLSGSNVVLNTGQEFLYTFAFNAFHLDFFITEADIKVTMMLFLLRENLYIFILMILRLFLKILGLIWMLNFGMI